MDNCGLFDYITAFHVFEHLIDPIKILKDLSKILSEHGEIIIEVPNSEDALLTLYENEKFAKFTYWSQHIFLFNDFTIKKMVQQSGLKLNWVKQIQRYPLSNHLYWLSKGLPGGQNIIPFFNNKLNDLYENELASIGKCDTLIASISK